MSQPNQFNQTSFTLAQKVVADAKRWRQRLDLEEIKLHDADAEFILVREALRSLAKPTRVNYRSALRRIDAWLGERPHTDSTLAAYVMELHRLGKAPATIGQAVIAVKFREKVFDHPSPAGKHTEQALRAVRREGSDRRKGSAPGLTLDQVESIIQAAEQDGTVWGLRDSAIIATAFYTGLRVGEAAAIRVSDLTFFNDGTGILRVRQSKTDQFGVGIQLGLATDAVRRIVAWLERAQIRSGVAFRAVQCNGFDGSYVVTSRAMSSGHVAEIVKARAKDVGIRCTSHSLRRAFAQHLTREGVPIQAVAAAGRWSDPAQVVRYVQNEQQSQSLVVSIFDRKQREKKRRRRAGRV